MPISCSVWDTKVAEATIVCGRLLENCFLGKKTIMTRPQACRWHFEGQNEIEVPHHITRSPGMQGKEVASFEVYFGQEGYVVCLNLCL